MDNVVTTYFDFWANFDEKKKEVLIRVKKMNSGLISQFWLHPLFCVSHFTPASHPKFFSSSSSSRFSFFCCFFPRSFIFLAVFFDIGRSKGRQVLGDHNWVRGQRSLPGRCRVVARDHRESKVVAREIIPGSRLKGRCQGDARSLPGMIENQRSLLGRSRLKGCC